MDSAPTTIAQIAIDEQITLLQNTLLNLKKERNTHSLVHRVSFDILGTIFTLAASEAQPRGASRRFNFCSVSSYWREIAISTPSVWAVLTSADRSPKWSRLLLERSRAASLTIRVDLRHAFEPSFATMITFVREVIRDHMGRIQEFEIHCRKADNLHRCLSDLPASTPRLQTLRIVNGWPSRSADNIPTISNQSLIDAKISFLELYRCKFNWNAPFLHQGMRHLKIGGTPDQSSLKHLPDVLRRMPDLQTLELENILSTAPDNTIVNSQPIILPGLRKLSLTSSPAISVAKLIHQLVIPQSTVLNLRCTALASDDDPAHSNSIFASAFQRLFNSMTSQGACDTLQPYRTLYVSGNSGKCVKLKAWRQVAKAPHLNVVLETSKTSLDVLPPLLKTLPLSGVQALTIWTELRQKDLGSIFGRLRHLESIFVNYSAASQIIRALIYKNRQDPNASYYHVRFPRLQRLSFSEVVFSDQYDVSYVKLDELRDCLMERCDRGFPLQTVDLRASYDIDEEGVKLLKEIVVDVPWDGISRFYRDALLAEDENTEDEDAEDYSEDESEGYFDSGNEDSEDYSHVQVERSIEDLTYYLEHYEV